MRIRVLVQCDAPGPPGDRQALFDGQFYELPDESAQTLIDEGKAEVAVEEEPAAKSVSGPPSDKAYDAPEDKAEESEEEAPKPRRRRRRKSE